MGGCLGPQSVAAAAAAAAVLTGGGGGATDGFTMAAAGCCCCCDSLLSAVDALLPFLCCCRDDFAGSVIVDPLVMADVSASRPTVVRSPVLFLDRPDVVRVRFILERRELREEENEERAEEEEVDGGRGEGEVEVGSAVGVSLAPPLSEKSRTRRFGELLRTKLLIWKLTGKF